MKSVKNKLHFVIVSKSNNLSSFFIGWNHQLSDTSFSCRQNDFLLNKWLFSIISNQTLRRNSQHSWPIFL